MFECEWVGAACLRAKNQGPASESESHDHGWGCTMVLLDTRVCPQNWVWCGVPHYQYRAAGSALALLGGEITVLIRSSYTAETFLPRRQKFVVAGTDSRRLPISIKRTQAKSDFNEKE